MTQQNVTVIAKGGVSGYVNKELELKTSPNGTHYVSILLGRGKKQNSDEFLPAYSLRAFGNVAKLFAATIAKGDLVRITKVGIDIQKDETLEKYNIANTFSLVVEEFEKITRNSNNTTQQSRPQQQPQPEAQQPAGGDSFDDDIPF